MLRKGNEVLFRLVLRRCPGSANFGTAAVTRQRHDYLTNRLPRWCLSHPRPHHCSSVPSTVGRRWAHATTAMQDEDECDTTVAHWPYAERCITVTTCADLYRKWRGTRHGYATAPPEGLPVPVRYVHTGLDRAERGYSGEGGDRRPLVVILTGAPGNYRDFSYLIPFLDRNGCDVVSPVWPDLSFSRKSGCWWHSSQEKTNLALDFLRTIGIKEADMLVAHSSGSYPALRMINDEHGLKVKSLVLLAPAGHKHLTKMNPPWFPQFLSWLYMRPGPYQRIVELMGLTFLTVTRHPLHRNMDNVLLAMKAMLHADKTQLKKDAEIIAARKLPTVVAISDNDKLIDLSTSLELVQILGGSSNTWYYDEDKRLKSKGNGNGPVKTLRFEKGTHYLFTRCADIINPEILNLLNSTVGRN
ncbi:unnamed protein product [Ixodes hexagonus]